MTWICLDLGAIRLDLVVICLDMERVVWAFGVTWIWLDRGRPVLTWGRFVWTFGVTWIWLDLGAMGLDLWRDLLAIFDLGLS